MDECAGDDRDALDKDSGPPMLKAGVPLSEVSIFSTENPTSLDDVATAADVVVITGPEVETVRVTLDAVGVDLSACIGEDLRLVGVCKILLVNKSMGSLDCYVSTLTDDAGAVYSLDRLACGGVRSYHLAPVLNGSTFMTLSKSSLLVIFITKLLVGAPSRDRIRTFTTLI